MTATAQSAFERDTAVEPAGDGVWRAQISPDWNAPLGPNGGYIAAIVLRAMEAATADPQRAPRSLTCHYLRPPAAGEALLHVAVERAGRNLTSLSARLVQDDRLCVLALGAFALDFPSPADYGTPMPGVPSPEAVEAIPLHPKAPPIAHRLEIRKTMGPQMLSGADEAVIGGWLALRDPAPVDAAVIALFTDALVPAPWARLTAPSPAPTIDLTIHFRARIPSGLEHVHAVMSSSTSSGGFFEEDGELRAPDGTLLAQGRQLAILIGES